MRLVNAAILDAQLRGAAEKHSAIVSLIRLVLTTSSSSCGPRVFLVNV